MPNRPDVRFPLLLLMSEESDQRFWDKVDKSPGQGPRGQCWIWKGAIVGRRGYGYFYVHPGRKVLAHRYALMRALGREISVKELACHGCDNPPCVRVGEGCIFLGDQKANMADAAAKGRHWTQLRPECIPRGSRHHGRSHPERMARGDAHWSRLHPDKTTRGERHGRARLSADDILCIRWLIDGGVTLQRIAERYGLSATHVSAIKYRKVWRHLDAGVSTQPVSPQG